MLSSKVMAAKDDIARDDIRPDILQGLEPDPVIEAYKKDVDLTLLRENLKLTVQQRVEKFMGMQRFAREVRGKAPRGPDR